MPVAAAHRTANRADVDDAADARRGPSRCASPRNRRTETPAMPRLWAAPASSRRTHASRRCPAATPPPGPSRQRPRRNPICRTAPRQSQTGRAGRRSIAAPAAAGSRRRQSPIAGTVPSGMAMARTNSTICCSALRHQLAARRCGCGPRARGNAGRCRRCTGGSRSIARSARRRVHLASHSATSTRAAMSRHRRESANSGNSVADVEQRKRVDGDARGRRGPRVADELSAGRGLRAARSRPAICVQTDRVQTRATRAAASSVQHHEITRNPSSEAAVAARSRSIRRVRVEPRLDCRAGTPRRNVRRR